MLPVRHAGVLGRPIAHSLSPLLHQAAYRALGLRWRYEAIDCGGAELAGVLAERADWAGFSCTMPLKHAALSLAVEVSPRAAAIGSANTLLPLSTPGSRTDGWRADNTDAVGMGAALRDAGGPVPGSATVLGAGGTAQAALAALAELGIEACDVLVRDRRRAGALLATAERLGVAVTLGSLDASAGALAADLVISTLPPRAADALCTAHPWRAPQTVFDVVYDPWPTPLAAAAGAAGAAVVSGAAMLLHQAAEQVRLMTGCAAPVDAMRGALRTARPNCGV